MTTVRQLTFLETPEINTSFKLRGRRDERPQTYTGIYAMHKYWSKKPFNLVSQYIERFSRQGEIVLDAFVGSGVTLVESVRLGRRAIGIDINPIAVLSTRMGVTHVDLPKLRATFIWLRSQVEGKINQLYRTQCPKCGSSDAIATHILWNNEQIVEIWTACEACRTDKCVKLPSENDIQLALEPECEPRWYPQVELVENSRINAKPGTRISDLFTPRALVALSILLEEIRHIPDVEIRQVMEFCFSAALPQASNMVFVIRRRGKANGQSESETLEVGSWVIGYWMPTEHFEINVWRCFENRFRRILKGKQEVNQVIPVGAKEWTSFEELNNAQQGYWISQGTATHLAIPDESVDYIFVDPPHGNRIPYLELSLMWNAWLGLDFDWENEIVVSEARGRQKNAWDYRRRLKDAFGELWRVLRTDRHISIAFNSLDDEDWLALLNSLFAWGFELVEIAALEYSARSVVQDTRRNALKTDFVMTCRKVLSGCSRKIQCEDSQIELERRIRDYLARHEDGAETYEILNHLMIGGLSDGVIFRISRVMEMLEMLAFPKRGRWHLKTA